MNIINRTIIENKISNGYDFKFGDYISKGFELFKKDMGMFILAFVVIMFTSWIPFLGVCIQTNFFTICHKVENGEKGEISDLFNFEKLGTLVVYYIILIACVLVILIPMFVPIILLGDSDGNSYDSDMQSALGGGMIIGMLVMYVLLLLFMGFTYFAIPLIHFGDYKAIEALKTSYKLVKKQILMIFLFFIVVGMLASVGVIACYIGMIVSIPFSYCVMYQSYKDVLFSENAMQNEINLIKGI